MKQDQLFIQSAYDEIILVLHNRELRFMLIIDVKMISEFFFFLSFYPGLFPFVPQSTNN